MRTLNMGADVFESDGSLRLDALAEHLDGVAFEESSVSAEGVPIGPRGAFEMGTTSLVLERMSRVEIPADGSTEEVPLLVVDLAVRSADRIPVSVDGELRQATVRISLAGETKQEGTLSISAETLSFEVPATVQIALVRDGTPIRTTTVETNLTGTNGTWRRAPGCPAEALSVPRFPAELCVEARLTSSLFELALRPPGPLEDRPPAEIHPEAVVSDAVGSIARRAVIGRGARIGAGAVVGPNARIGENAVVGDSALVGENTRIAPGSVLDANAVVDGEGRLQERVRLGRDVVIGRGVTLGDSSFVGAGTRIGGRSTIGAGVTIGADVRGERRLTVGTGVQIAPGLFLTRGAEIAAGTQVVESRIRCSELVEGSPVSSPSACEAAGGWIYGYVPLPEVYSARSVAPGERVEPLDPDSLPAELAGLQADVDSAGSGDPEGPIDGRTYTDDTYDCDDFASDLEEALTAQGYEATMTCYWCYEDNPDHTWYNWLWTSETVNTSAHCLTDVHADGRLIWIEPQTGEVGVDLDFDGDGRVEYIETHGGGNTDDDCRIEVYADRRAGEDAGIDYD